MCTMQSGAQNWKLVGKSSANYRADKVDRATFSAEWKSALRQLLEDQNSETEPKNCVTLVAMVSSVYT